jgi:hypothetical protein
VTLAPKASGSGLAHYMSWWQATRPGPRPRPTEAKHRQVVRRYHLASRPGPTRTAPRPTEARPPAPESPREPRPAGETRPGFRCEPLEIVKGTNLRGAPGEYAVIRFGGFSHPVTLRDALARCCGTQTDPAAFEGSIELSAQANWREIQGNPRSPGDSVIPPGKSLTLYCHRRPVRKSEVTVPIKDPCDCLTRLIYIRFSWHRHAAKVADAARSPDELTKAMEARNLNRKILATLLGVQALHARKAAATALGQDATAIDRALRDAYRQAEKDGFDIDWDCKRATSEWRGVELNLEELDEFDRMAKAAAKGTGEAVRKAAKDAWGQVLYSELARHYYREYLENEDPSSLKLAEYCERMKLYQRAIESAEGRTALLRLGLGAGEILPPLSSHEKALLTGDIEALSQRGFGSEGYVSPGYGDAFAKGFAGFQGQVDEQALGAIGETLGTPSILEPFQYAQKALEGIRPTQLFGEEFARRNPGLVQMYSALWGTGSALVGGAAGLEAFVLDPEGTLRKLFDYAKSQFDEAVRESGIDPENMTYGEYESAIAQAGARILEDMLGLRTMGEGLVRWDTREQRPLSGLEATERFWRGAGGWVAAILTPAVIRGLRQAAATTRCPPSRPTVAAPRAPEPSGPLLKPKPGAAEPAAPPLPPASRPGPRPPEPRAADPTLPKPIDEVIERERAATTSQKPPQPTTPPRLPPFKGGKTAGEFHAPNGSVFELKSGWTGPAESIPRGTAGFDIVTRTHVEGHAAALMRQSGLMEGTLYINNPKICQSCEDLLPRMLPAASKLTVVLPDGSARTFTGR